MRRIVGQELDKIYAAADKAFCLGDKVADALGREFVYIKYKSLSGSDGAAGLGICACDGAYDQYEGTADTNHADAVPGIPYGQLQAALTDTDEGFVQSKGPSRKDATTGGSVSQGNELVLSGAARGVFAVKGSHRATVGTARSDDSGTTLAAGELFLQCAV